MATATEDSLNLRLTLIGRDIWATQYLGIPFCGYHPDSPLSESVHLRPNQAVAASEEVRHYSGDSIDEFFTRDADADLDKEWSEDMGVSTDGPDGTTESGSDSAQEGRAIVRIAPSNQNLTLREKAVAASEEFRHDSGDSIDEFFTSDADAHLHEEWSEALGMSTDGPDGITESESDSAQQAPATVRISPCNQNLTLREKAVAASEEVRHDSGDSIDEFFTSDADAHLDEQWSEAVGMSTDGPDGLTKSGSDSTQQAPATVRIAPSNCRFKYFCRLIWIWNHLDIENC